MISDGVHQEIDLKKEISDIIPIFIVPNINSEGPRILPKVPILKNYYNAKVVSNPARFCIQGKECLFLNYPLVKSLNSKCVYSSSSNKLDHLETCKRTFNILFSQNNLALADKFFWKQSAFLAIN